MTIHGFCARSQSFADEVRTSLSEMANDLTLAVTRALDAKISNRCREH